MMASHGRGQRVGRIGLRALGLRALGLAALMAVPGGLVGTHSARGCHIAHQPKAAEATKPTPTKAAEVLNPTSLVQTALPTPAPLTPSALANPPVADGIVPTVTPTTLNWVAPTTTAAVPACTCTCPNPAMTPPPIVSNPPPTSPSALQPAIDTPSTPEPTSIVSALAMVAAAVAWGRRSRQIG